MSHISHKDVHKFYCLMFPVPHITQFLNNNQSPDPNHYTLIKRKGYRDALKQKSRVKSSEERTARSSL